MLVLARSFPFYTSPISYGVRSRDGEDFSLKKKETKAREAKVQGS